MKPAVMGGMPWRSLIGSDMNIPFSQDYRVSADLDMVRHSIAWIIKTIVECIVLWISDGLPIFSP